MKLPLIITRGLGTTEVYFKQNGPTVMTIAGTLGIAATAVLTARSALKAQPKVADLKDETQKVFLQAEEGLIDQRERNLQVTRIWVAGAKDLAVTYAPPIIVGCLSAAAILASHSMLLKQRAGLVAAYTALSGSLEAYRRRVASSLGQEKEEVLWRSRYETLEEDVDAEGRPCLIEGIDPNLASQYCKVFDSSNPNWTKTADYNKTFLYQMQRYANDRLGARGYLFLNEVYEMLGFEYTDAGQVVGWRAGEGDGYISFGIENLADANNNAFVNGLDPNVLLDFNVQGPITIPKRRKPGR